MERPAAPGGPRAAPPLGRPRGLLRLLRPLLPPRGRPLGGGRRLDGPRRAVPVGRGERGGLGLPVPSREVLCRREARPQAVPREGGSVRLSLWPSIDLSEGRVVRLLRGEMSALTTYDADPGELVARFAEEGADGVHVVDLDAAFGRGDNEPAVRRLLRAATLPVQVGGGIRTLEAVARALDAGAARVVVGSLPFTEPAAFEEVMRRHGSRTVVALDCRDSRPSIRGWTADAGAGTAAEAARCTRGGRRWRGWRSRPTGPERRKERDDDARGPGDPLPGRGRRPRREGNPVREPARRGRPGRR
ncbi:hypothetical protein FBQ97_14075, partial [Acidobacteria bacterium ACD]|nr:hypothetical protein [Acidobacteria bacterium ACD]